jgi:hypothetical protein
MCQMDGDNLKKVKSSRTFKCQKKKKTAGQNECV